MSAWIKVEKRFPKEDTRVRVWNKGTDAEEYATYSNGRFIDESGTDCDLTDNITHWQSLSAPPVTP